MGEEGERRGEGGGGRGEERGRESGKGEKIKGRDNWITDICRYTLLCGSISMTPFLLIAIRSTSGNFGSVDCWWRRYRFGRTHDQLHLSVSINIHPQRTLTSKKAEPNVG